jgi:hypothetical protein
VTPETPLTEPKVALEPAVAALPPALAGLLQSPLFRHWTLREAIAPEPFSFSRKVRDQLRAVLATAGARKDFDNILKVLEAEVSEYQAWWGQERRRTVLSTRREQIGRLADGMSVVTTGLKELDFDTRRDVAAHVAGRDQPSEKPLAFVKPRELEDLELLLCAVFDPLLHLEKYLRAYLARASRSRGRPKGNVTLVFCVAIGEALARVAGPRFPITARKEGPFEQILAICIAAMRGAPVKAVHELARHA